MILETTKFTDASESAELFQRLDAECEKVSEHLKDVYFVIANYIRERVSADPSLATKLKGKTIEEAYKKIEAEARAIHAKTKGNCVMIPPERGLAIVGEYCFGTDGKSAAPAAPTAEPTPAEPRKEVRSEIVDIFDLL